MKSADWDKIKDIFSDAIELPAGKRGPFVEEKCRGNTEMLAEVESLLAASSDPENLIENNAIDLAAHIGAKESDQSGKHFGNYRMIREIGSGGMGTVFLATRDDGEFTMHVALKIVRQSVVDRDILSRFRRERQILAGLNHPNIAVLHDGGLSEKGEPYLAMEYVDGDTLIDHANKNQLTIEQRLRLFQKVCSAVSYAHRNLVVHRDIKPSNILVTAGGEPKLLDFGLAKAFEEDGSMTQTVLRAFTPAYASPEQIQGGNITTASDIYSLGVVFYELLTGRKPLNVENQSYDEIVHTVSETIPLKPSSVEPVAADNETGRRLRGDLDNIALMALRKRPERRYKTVDDLAEDIDRHLTGRPISARPNTSAYLLGKFIRRNKVAVAAAALVVISLLAGVAVSLWQADKARKERDRAEKRFQDVRQLSNSLLFEISPKIERLPGSIEARQLLVQRALGYLDSLASESQTDDALLSELASAYEKVGDLQGNIDRPNLNDLAGAIASFEKAASIRDRLPHSVENSFRLAQNLTSNSAIRNRQNDVSGALTDAVKAISIFESLISEGNATPEIQYAAAGSMVGYGQIYSLNNQYALAIPILNTAIDSLAKLDQNDLKTKLLSAKATAYLANAQSWDGQQTDAESNIHKAISLSETLGKEFPNVPDVLSSTRLIYSIATSIYDETQPELSLRSAQNALATSKRALELDKADLQAKHDLARAHSLLGNALRKTNKMNEAFENLTASETILNELIGQEPKNTVFQRDLAVLYVRMGDASEKTKDFAGALLKYINSAVIFERLSSDDIQNTRASRDLAQSLKSVGKMQIELGQNQSARITLEKARDLLKALIARNALGDWDKQLVDDVEKMLRSV